MRKHFRVNNSNILKGHPTYVFKKKRDYYYFVGLTRSPITDKIPNAPLIKNPNPHSKQIPQFIRPFSDKEKIVKFNKKKLKGWKLAKEDIKVMRTSIKNKKNERPD
jgi:hypothetical protein